jgi:dienelactone hydrolase
MEIVSMVLKILGILIGTCAVLFVLELAIVALVPGFSVPTQPLERSGRTRQKRDTPSHPSRKEVTFESEGITIHAWLYLPDNVSDQVPCIIMGPGGGGTREMGLEMYALRYREAGFAALVFDYRYFGESEGEPRQLIWIPSQLQDYRAAIEYAKRIREVDPAKIALWGTSLSGGHVIVSAAKYSDITCVVAQCPWLDGLTAARYAAGMQSIARGIRLIMHGQRDLVRSWFGLSPHRIPIAGRSGSVALLPFTEAYEAFEELAPDQFINEACARIAIRWDKYRPIKKATKARCPVLFQICDRDEPVPARVIEETAQTMNDNAEVIHYPIGHFDIYSGENFERSVKDQIDFFKKHLTS